MLITIKQNDKALDIKVNEKQKIITVLDILDEKGLICVGDMYKVFSLRESKIVFANKSFEENDLYNGDILEIVE